MSRNIVLLSDGTGNSAAKVWRTNVWRIFEALDLSGSDQVAFYDDGVGTSSFKPLAILGGAFGFGLKRNVVDIYKFVCRNYRERRERRNLRFRLQPRRLHHPRRHRADSAIRDWSRPTTKRNSTKGAAAYREYRRGALSYSDGPGIRRIGIGPVRDVLLSVEVRQARKPSGQAHRFRRRLGHGCRLRPADGRDDARRQPVDLAARTSRLTRLTAST